jgi:hypothetical protein
MLNIRELKDSDYPQVHSTLADWEAYVRQTHAVSQGQKGWLFSEDSSRLSAVSGIARSIRAAIGSGRPLHLYGCYDTAGTLQGISQVSYEETACVVDELATRPQNIHGLTPIRGVGTALMQDMEARCRLLNRKSLIVIPTDTSESFYQKLGYQTNGDGCMEKFL